MLKVQLTVASNQNHRCYYMRQKAMKYIKTTFPYMYRGDSGCSTESFMSVIPHSRLFSYSWHLFYKSPTDVRASWTAVTYHLMSSIAVLQMSQKYFQCDARREKTFLYKTYMLTRSGKIISIIVIDTHKSHYLYWSWYCAKYKVGNENWQSYYFHILSLAFSKRDLELCHSLTHKNWIIEKRKKTFSSTLFLVL